MLPIYTVLVPLFRETKIVPKLLQSLEAIDYPKDRLDIKILLEASDPEMLLHFEKLVPPPHIEVLIVPAGRPQTKPRALNYGLLFARGTYLVIYDAEDIPEPKQLRHAVTKFDTAPRDVTCLQAQLTYFNSQENWLTKQFAAEYAILFGGIVPVLSAARLPILLGGTSNHFKVTDLIDIGGWDPFNVTEDADLGVRLFRSGKRALWLDSVTYEEAVTDYWSWTKQRARWLKGFLQTWFVHMRHPFKLYAELGGAGFWIVQCMTLGVFLTCLLHPLFISATIYSLVLNLSAENWSWRGLANFGVLGAFVFFCGYAASMMLAAKTLRRQFGVWDWSTLLSMPAYWLLSNLAAFLALYDFIVAPHHWRKTMHGTTKLKA